MLKVKRDKYGITTDFYVIIRYKIGNESVSNIILEKLHFPNVNYYGDNNIEKIKHGNVIIHMIGNIFLTKCVLYL